MKKSIKPVLALIMLLSLILSACLPGGEVPTGGAATDDAATTDTATADDTATTDDDTAAPAADETQDDVAPPAGDMVGLRMLTWMSEAGRDPFIDEINRQLAPYNAYIEYNFVDNNMFDNVTNIQFAAGEGPDLMETGGQFLGHVAMGYLMDLSDQPWVGNFLQSYLDAYTVGGQLWAVPHSAMYAGIAYNVDIFETYGIEVPTTWDELLTIGVRLEEAGFTGRPFITGAQDLGTPLWTMFGTLNVFFYSNHENRIFDEDFSNLVRTVEDVWYPYLERYWIPFVEAFYTPDMVGLTTAMAQNEFALGEVAMAAGGGMGMGGQTDTLREINPDLTYSIFAYPTPDGSTGWAIGAPGTGTGVNPAGHNIELSLRAIAAIASYEGQRAMTVNVATGESFGPIGHVDLQHLPLAPEAHQTFIDAMNAGNLYATWVKWPNAGQVLEDQTRALQMMLLGEVTLREFLQITDEKNAATYIGAALRDDAVTSDDDD